MSTLTDNDVKKIAHLARLAINDTDVPIHAKNLSDILNLVEQMNKVDTTNITPMAHPQNISQRLRADKITENNERELFQRIAPAMEAGLYLVPKVIDNEWFTS